MSTPFKMKGHTLPGINQKKSSKVEDGRAASSAFQKKSFTKTTMGKHIIPPSVSDTSTVNPKGKNVVISKTDTTTKNVKKILKGKDKIIGETKSRWMSRSFGNPGWQEDKRVWDGKKWVKKKK